MPAGRILIVEDDRAVRDMLVEYLAWHGYEVAEAETGGDAMREAIERTLPDVVLLDVNLPGEDGLTLARFLREHYDVGIIMVTGAADIVDRVAGLEVGADDYVTKPFDPRELRARAEERAAASQARRAGGRPRPAPPAARTRVRSAPAGSTSRRTSSYGADGAEIADHRHGVRPAQGVRRAAEPGAVARPAAHAHAQP